VKENRRKVVEIAVDLELPCGLPPPEEALATSRKILRELKRLEDVSARSKGMYEAIREFKHSGERPRKKTITMTDGNEKYYVADGDNELIQRLHDD